MWPFLVIPVIVGGTYAITKLDNDVIDPIIGKDRVDEAVSPITTGASIGLVIGGAALVLVAKKYKWI